MPPPLPPISDGFVKHFHSCLRLATAISIENNFQRKYLIGFYTYFIVFCIWSCSLVILCPFYHFFYLVFNLLFIVVVSQDRRDCSVLREKYGPFSWEVIRRFAQSFVVFYEILVRSLFYLSLYIHRCLVKYLDNFFLVVRQDLTYLWSISALIVLIYFNSKVVIHQLVEIGT